MVLLDQTVVFSLELLLHLLGLGCLLLLQLDLQLELRNLARHGFNRELGLLQLRLHGAHLIPYFFTLLLELAFLLLNYRHASDGQAVVPELLRFVVDLLDGAQPDVLQNGQLYPIVGEGVVLLAEGGGEALEELVVAVLGEDVGDDEEGGFEKEEVEGEGEHVDPQGLEERLDGLEGNFELLR